VQALFRPGGRGGISGSSQWICWLDEEEKINQKLHVIGTPFPPPFNVIVNINVEVVDCFCGVRFDAYLMPHFRNSLGQNKLTFSFDFFAFSYDLWSLITVSYKT